MIKMSCKEIKAIRPMTAKEMRKEYWTGTRPIVIELVDGTIIYPSQDSEGNGPGCMFGVDSEGNHFGWR
jgi:hypothetical protein